MEEEAQTEKRPAGVIKTSDELATLLGFTKQETSGPSSGYSVYQKKVSLPDGDKTSTTKDLKTCVQLFFKKSGKGEGIGVGFRLGEEGSAWHSEITLAKLLAGDQESSLTLGRQSDESGVFETQYLRTLGYQTIFDLLSSESGQKYFAQEFKKIAENFEAGRWYMHILAEEIAENLPEYSGFVENYVQGKEWIYYKNPDKKDRATRLLALKIYPNRLVIESSRLRLKTGETISNHKSPLKDRYLLIPPSNYPIPDKFSTGWTFEKDEEEARKILDLAFEYVKGELKDQAKPGLVTGIERIDGMTTTRGETEPFHYREASIQFPDGEVAKQITKPFWKIGSRIIRRNGVYINLDSIA